MYTIYHIPEKNKVGCTENLQRRMKELKAIEFEILEVHNNRSEATKREIQLQLEMYGKRDCNLTYEESLKMKSYPAIQKWKQTIKTSEVWKNNQLRNIELLQRPELKEKRVKAQRESNTIKESNLKCK